MGLDMFLYTQPENEVIEASEEVAYWRKANAVHKWFVNTIQNGHDDCGDYPVTEAQLQALKRLCEKVLSEPELAAEYLPTGSGFFFGCTDYDEHYFRDLGYTISVIDNVLGQGKKLYYSSSW